MARGDIFVSPWFYDTGEDYLGRHLTITVPFDNTTRAILGATIHRDPGCVYTNIVFDHPLKSPKQMPDVPDGDTTVTAQQVRQYTGFRTIEELMAVQVTAEAH